MYDYPEPQRSEIMDFLFKDHFGAGLTIAKVEVGGDAQQTDGTTASYKHSADDPPNFNRSHIWWAMSEAKRRQPNVTFYGLCRLLSLFVYKITTVHKYFHRNN